jgi:cytochrome bd ubiquinol oxidase subunit II
MAYRLLPYLSGGLLIFLIVVFVYSLAEHCVPHDWCNGGNFARVQRSIRWDEVPFLAVTVIFLCAFGTSGLSFWSYMIPLVLTLEEAAAHAVQSCIHVLGRGSFCLSTAVLHCDQLRHL